MPSTSSGRIAKSRRNQKTTPHQKNHRWESFTTKISKLHSLDPLRKVRRHDLDDEDLSATTSYLRNGIERWTDLNVTKSFGSFRREILPLCESLAQMLHFEDKIMDVLAAYLEKQETEMLEALLDLLTAFAHDLGVRFEKHYPRSLALVLAVASRPQDADVIEWTFAALAFLFKYLARLLVPDLTPTYDALAPLLGKSRQPGHIARFAGEAMSFLVKKAAAPANRETALPLIVAHARDDLLSMRGTKSFELYYHGIMTLFAEAIKGAGNTIHSTGPDTFGALVRAVPETEYVEEDKTWMDVCCGVLTSVVHHSTIETFGLILDAVVTEAEGVAELAASETHPGKLAFFVRLLGITSGVRKGSRVGDWSATVQTLTSLLQAMTKYQQVGLQEKAPIIWGDMMTNAAVVWDQAPMDALIPSISKVTHLLASAPLVQWYIPFCTLFAELNPERFRSLFQKNFQR